MKKHTSRILSLLLVLALLCSVFTVSAADSKDVSALTEYTQGADTSAVKEFKISSADALTALSTDIKPDDGKGTYNMAGVTFYLANDIKLSGSFTPISNVTYPADAFAGTFDGNGHSITGLSINSSSTGGIGLFSFVNGGTIQNLKVEGTINSTASQFVGGIVGKTQGTVKITTCSFSGSITTSKSGSSAAAGGILGRVNSGSPEIKNCANFADITSTGGLAAGIAGYIARASITIENCYNAGKIKALWYPSGIISNVSGTNSAKSVIENCYNIGEISVFPDKTFLAGISANCSAATKNCYSLYPAVDSFGSGKNGASEKVTSPDGLLEKLGSAYIADSNAINSGYPIFPWQEGKKAEPETPSVKIQGADSIYMTNSGEQPTLTLTAKLTALDSETAIIWSIEDGADFAKLDQSDNNAVITPLSPGKITVKAETADGNYFDTAEIFIIPHINSIKIGGTVAVGETVRAIVYTFPNGDEYDDEAFPALSYTWKRLSKENYDSGNTGFNSYETIPGATGKTLTIPEEYSGDYLAFDIYYGGNEMKYGSPEKILSNDERIARLDASLITVDESPVKEEKTFSLVKTGENGSSISWESSDESVISSETGKVTLPETGENITVTLTAKATYNGASAKRKFEIRVYSIEEIEKEKADKLRPVTEALEKMNLSVLSPVYGKDENVLTMFKSKLSSVTEEKIAVSIKSTEVVYDGGSVAQDGKITFFYKDPATAPAIHNASVNVTFTLSVNGESTDFTVPVVIPWDEARVKAEMENKITSKIVIPDTDVTEDLSLSKVIGDNKWALISWTSTNTKAISISNKNQSTADTLFDPYVGVVRRGANDEAVTLTAKCTFGFSDKEIAVFKTFDLNVKALDKEAADKITAYLNARMDEGFKKAGLTDAVTGEKLTATDGEYTVINDVLFPTTRDFNIDGKLYPVTMESSDPDVIFTYDVANAARVTVYRSASGENKEATVTLTITDKDANISVSREFNFTVLPITEEEIVSELALMEKVKASFFDGIKGRNESADFISYNLSPFVEVYEKNGSLVWVTNVKKMTNSGIVPTPIKGWEELEAYRLFKSSNPASVAHETLNVSLKNNPKAVTIESSLSSETLGRYGKLYESNPEKYASYAQLALLYDQSVSVDVIVRGKTSKKGAPLVAVSEKISASFSMKGPDGMLIEETKCENLTEGTTAFDVFKSVLAENNYKYDAKGTYVSAIITPDGEKISELDYGEYSGWLYKVNGKLPNVVMSAYGLSDGDEVLFYYTKDYNKDYKSSSSSSKVENTKKEDAEDTKTDDTKKDDTKTDDTKKDLTFRDVNKSDWFFDAVNYMSENGIMKGVSDNEFAPGETLTRAMFVTLLYRLEKEPEATGASFTDVSDKDWFSKAVLWAYENKIVSGVSDTEFAPDGALSRQDAATILYRYAKFKGFDVSVGENTNILSYEDFEKIGEYAAPALSFTAGSGIMKGRTEKTINPDGTATRAEAAAIFMRFINYFNK